MKYLLNILFGAIVGVANIIPGVSGGTMAVILNIYDKLIYSVNACVKGFVNGIKAIFTQKSFKELGSFFKSKEFLFVLTILLGAGVGIILFSNIIKFSLENVPIVTNFIFIGLIVGSIPLIVRYTFSKGFKPVNLIFGVITFAIMIYMIFANSSETAVITSLDALVFVKLVAFSAIAAACMIVPGISGSFVMLLLGVYTTVTAAISDMNLMILCPVGIGVVIGLLGGAKVMEILIKKYHQATYMGILGLVLGSIPVILLKETYFKPEIPFNVDLQFIIAIVLMIIAGLITLWFGSEKVTNMFKEKTEE